MNKIFKNGKNSVLTGLAVHRITHLIPVIILFFNSVFSYAQNNSKKIVPPDYGVYVGAFPDMGGTEDSVTVERLEAFENLTGQKPVWVYFSNNWFGKIKFPEKEVKIINEYGSIPFIRLMPRTDFLDYQPDPIYTLQRIINGKFDKELKAWGADAKKFGEPIIVEFGLEMNGDWFPWSGVYNDKNPEKYKQAYIHIIELFKNEGADNITYVYHVNYGSAPEGNWNTMASYYPGDEYIDWIGMSIYGAQVPSDKWTDIKEIFEKPYNEMAGISPNKPLAVIEFGVIEHPKKPQWIKDFFDMMKSEKYNRIKAVCYWHSVWENADKSISNMRLDSSPETLRAYKNAISDDFFKPEIKFK